MVVLRDGRTGRVIMPLEKADISYELIVGGQTAEERERAKDNFQSGRVRVILCTIAAGGIGITLTRAATACFLQRSWSMVDNSQAEDRVHRIGSEIHDKVEIIDWSSAPFAEPTIMYTSTLMVPEGNPEGLQNMHSFVDSGLTVATLAGAYGVFLLYTAGVLGWRGLGVGDGRIRSQSHLRANTRQWLAQAGLEGVGPAEFFTVMAVLFVSSLFGPLVIVTSFTPYFCSASLKLRPERRTPMLPVIVVGSQTSSNSNRLRELAERCGSVTLADRVRSQLGPLEKRLDVPRVLVTVEGTTHPNPPVGRALA